MKVYVIGVGLIGGSMALDIQDLYPEAVIFGVDSNDSNLNEAERLGVIHKSAAIEAVADADIVIVAVPVDAALIIVPKVLDLINDNALVFDTGSTKAAVCKIISNHPRRKQFMATHPIAGTEFSGPTAALRGLFEGKTNIICEVEKTAFKLQEKGMQLFRDLGMRIRLMEPKAHDRHIAYVSHLSHISSFMLGKTVIVKEKHESDIFDMAGSGFESTVRLAKSSPAMWTPIFKQNKKQVLKSLEEYIANLEHFRNLLEQDNFEAIFEEMQNTNRIREILNRQQQRN
ncbi:MAG: prephenate dehydrogenase [Flavobacterium sp. BFFFF1]|uniref:prephenate dehydrogenase n=1 Tax=Flavobacterium sp. BFFFF1 TaxID=2015557 RepID=UPI000BCAC2FE|nr:prephenate dehydrogenase [Flavobacterium sp. BFFFF1]OYU79827.1 MAG: prephenate dehydrogenase [Flavobacterium sp. BFFFF1]